MKRLLPLLLLCVALPGPGMAQSGPLPTAPAPAPTAEFDRLANLLVPREKLLPMIEPMFKLGFDARLAKDARARAVFERYPGMRDAIFDAIRPEMVAMIDQALIGMHADIRALLVVELKATEANTLADFLASPAGAKLYGGALLLGAEGAADETLDEDKMLVRLMAQMTPDELRALDAFGRTPAAAKFGVLAARIEPISAKWGKRVVEENGERLRKLIDDAIQQYLDRRPEKRT